MERSVDSRHFRRLSFHFRQQKRFGQGAHCHIIDHASPERIRQRRQATLAGDHRTRAALGLVGEIEIFKRLLGVGGEQLRAKHVVKLSLLVNAFDDGCAPRFHFVQIFGALTYVAQLDFVESAGRFLAIARNERESGALCKERERAAHLLRRERKFSRDARDNFGSKRIGHVPRKLCATLHEFHGLRIT